MRSTNCRELVKKTKSKKQSWFIDRFDELKVIVFVITCLFCAPSVASDFIGVTAALNGEVLRTASKNPEASIGALSSGEKIFLGDDIKVSESGRLQVMLVDETVFTLGAGAEMTIDQFVYDPNQANQLTANIKKGAFRFVSGKIAKSKRDAMKVAVPSATIAVRGTQVAGIIDDQGTADIVLLGPGPNSFGATPGAIGISNELGTTDVLRGGYAVTVTPEVPPTDPVIAEPSLLQRLESAVSELASEEIAQNIPEELATERNVALVEALVEKGIEGAGTTNDAELLSFISEEEAQQLSDEGLNFTGEALFLLANYFDGQSLGEPPAGPTLADLTSASFQGSRRYITNGNAMTSGGNVSNGTGVGSFSSNMLVDFDLDRISVDVTGSVDNVKLNASSAIGFDFAFSGVGNISNLNNSNPNGPSFEFAAELDPIPPSSLYSGTAVPNLNNVSANTFDISATASGSIIDAASWAITGSGSSDQISFSMSGGLVNIANPADVGYVNVTVATDDGTLNQPADNVGGTGVAVGAEE